jgi:hypothetical protein
VGRAGVKNEKLWEGYGGVSVVLEGLEHKRELSITL